MEKFHPSLTTQDYLLQANTSLTTIVQIETKEALANVDAIAATEGVDVLLVSLFAFLCIHHIRIGEQCYPLEKVFNS